MSLNNYAELAHDLAKRDEPRDKMFQRHDKMYKCEWDKPDSLDQEWILPIRSTDAHNTLRGTTRLLSARDPVITVWPTSTDIAAKEKADKQERALKWFMSVAFQRQATTALRDIVMSAARYDEVTYQVVYLPYQIKLLESFGGGTATSDRAVQHRLRAMERSGPFAFIVRNPRSVHSLYSEYGLEAVSHERVWDTKKLLSFYGSAATEIRVAVENKVTGKASPFYAVWDIADYDRRLVMAVPVVNEMSSMPTLDGGKWPKNALTILDVENDLDFIPWVCRKGGTDLESDSDHSHVPMLYSIDQSNQYEIQNIMETIVVSDAVAHAAAPRGKKSGPGAENIMVEYGDPNQDVVVGPGQDYTPLPASKMDESIFNLAEWMSAKMEKSTLPSVLQGGNTAAMKNYAALAMSVQSGMIVVDPYKKLAEQALSDGAIQMLLWVKKGGEKIEAFEKNRDKITQKETYHTFTLSPDDINEKGMRVDVELQPETPVDRGQRVNTALMLQKMGVSKRESMTLAGLPDASDVMDEARYEAMEEFFLQRFFSKLSQKDQLEFMGASQEQQAALQMKVQEAQMQMQQQAQQAAQAQQQQMIQAQQAQGQAAPPEYQMPGAPEKGMAGPNTPPGMANPEVGGAGFNPEAGGQPPATVAPGTGQNQEIPF